MNKNIMTWPQAFAAWQDYARDIGARAERIDRDRHERGWHLAATVGIPHDMCCLHNASIDDDMRGWCHQNPQRLKIAKQANWLVNQWTAHRIARRAIMRKWNELMTPLGACAYDIE